MDETGERDAYPHGPDGAGGLLLCSNALFSALLQRSGWAGTDEGVKVSWDRFIAYGRVWRMARWRSIWPASAIRGGSGPLVRRVQIANKKLIYETPAITNRKTEVLVKRVRWRKFV
jgi:hypothetical protein